MKCLALIHTEMIAYTLQGHSRLPEGTLTFSSRHAQGQLNVQSRSAQSRLTFSSMYTHVQLKVRSRSTQGTLTASASYTHVHLKVRSRSAQATLTFDSRYAQGQLKVHSRSTQGTLTASARYTHVQLKVRSRSAQGTFTVWDSVYSICTEGYSVRRGIQFARNRTRVQKLNQRMRDGNRCTSASDVPSNNLRGPCVPCVVRATAGINRRI
jgi:hypothetical protein